MKFRRLIPALTLGVLCFTGCDRKNNPLLSLPGSGVTTVSLFIPQIDTSGGSGTNRIFIYATDDVGNPITTFSLGNFSILEGGNPGVPFEVGVVTEPLYLALAIDRSGSMSLEGRTAAANSAAISIINSLGSNDFASIIEFESVVTAPIGFTNDKSVLTTYVSTGQATNGGTALYDAILECAGQLNGQKGRRLLLVLTDGDDTASASTISDAIAGVNGGGLSGNMVGLGSGINATFLQRIAQDTGGTYSFSSNGSDLSAAFAAILVRFENLVYVRYQRRSSGSIKAYLNYGAITASASKTFD